ncbi:hypothetical protein [Clostridium sp. C2-6-12]|uniref:hypothetical protein n=1 Tax=Clostridium sp. C2-6-12 TaxID=2698832 RepID=UPI001369C8A3|nr:hypothetical protein [Clostridium sp. C2-6-12]
MKKSTIIVILGFFIVITGLLSMNDERVYKKQKHFETVNEVLQQLDNKPLKTYDEKFAYKETDELMECISERKRLTDSKLDYGKIEILNVEELKDEDKQELLNGYNKHRNQFTKRREITREEPVRIKAKAWYSHIENGKRVFSDPRKLDVDLVLVDEGEGLVIDYLLELRNVEENKDA